MKNNIWKRVKTVKDMPRKSGDYLMLTDMGWPLTFYWNAHSRKAYIHAERNHYDPNIPHDKDPYVDDYKVDGVRMSLRNPSFAWCEIPHCPDDIFNS